MEYNLKSKIPDRLIRLPEVINRTGLSRSSIYLRVSNGTMPSPISLGDGRAVAWQESLIDDWIQARIDASAKLNKAEM